MSWILVLNTRSRWGLFQHISRFTIEVLSLGMETVSFFRVLKTFFFEKRGGNFGKTSRTLVTTHWNLCTYPLSKHLFHPNSMIYCKQGSLSPRMIYIEKTLSMFGVIWIYFLLLLKFPISFSMFPLPSYTEWNAKTSDPGSLQNRSLIWSGGCVEAQLTNSL